MAEVYEIAPIQRDNRKTRVCAYARVSSESEDQRNSFFTQVEFYTNFINQNPDWEFVDIYADEGVTGLSMDKRDDFQRMMRDCRKGRIDRILTKSVSRFARNTKECLESVRELKSLGVSVLFEEQEIDTAEISSEIILTFYSHSAQEESLSISSNMRWSYRRRMESGEFLGTIAPYGYELKNGILEINQQEANIIQYIFKSYLSGDSKWKIADDLTTMGLTTRGGGTKWHKSTIHYILKNERYCGNALLQKRYTLDSLPFQKKINKGEKTQYFLRNSHEAIISPDDFENAQYLNSIRRSKQSPKQEYPLSRKIKCGVCGMTFRRKKRNHPMWACLNHDQDSAHCTQRNLPETGLYDAFVRLYNKLKANRYGVLYPLQQQLFVFKNSRHRNDSQISKINQEIAELSGKLLVLGRIKSKGLLDESLFISQSNKINHKLVELKTQKGHLMEENEENLVMNNTRLLIDILECGPDYLETFDEELFNNMVDQIVTQSDKTVLFVLINGLSLPEHVAPIVRYTT